LLLRRIACLPKAASKDRSVAKKSSKASVAKTPCFANLGVAYISISAEAMPAKQKSKRGTLNIKKYNINIKLSAIGGVRIKKAVRLFVI
jgi:hypothetical protein